MRDLEAIHSSQNSFYGKAKVDEVVGEHPYTDLYSYDTHVVRYQDGKFEFYPAWNYSATTLRHVSEFVWQMGNPLSHNIGKKSRKELEETGVCYFL